MKHNIIKTENYLLVVDKSEIKEGDWLYHFVHGIRLFNEQETKNFDSKTYSDKNWKKIIAHLPLNNSPILEGVDLLPPLEDDVEKLAMDKLISKWSHLYQFGYPKKPYPTNYENDLNIIMIGIYQAREKYRYTEDDMRIAIQQAFLSGVERLEDFEKVESMIIGNIQQLKMPVGFEFKIQKNCPFDFTSRCTMDRCNCESKTKTTTNSQGLTQLLGEYQY